MSKDLSGRLTCLGELSPQAVGRLVTGSPGYLVFTEFRVAVGLRVAVRARPPYLDAAVMDGIALPERRKDERVKLATPARIVFPDDSDSEGPTDWTTTINLSERGALVRYDAVLDRRKRVGLELMFGDDPRPISAEAKVARRLADAIGVVFESIPSDDATRLREYLAGLRHQPRWLAAHS
jgi:hypothetical protein